MRRQGLRTRLARLESQRSERRIPKVFARVYDDADCDIVGLYADSGCARVTVLRQGPSEPLEALCARAASMTGSHTFAALYARQSAPERVPGPSELPTHTEGPQSAPDPFALAGIGRQATRAELRKMLGGVPPERIV
jgi:hypothetical protein